MLDLESAIRHCEEVAEKKEEDASWFWDKEGNPNYENCVKCAKEHRQLAEWLRELKRYRNVRRILSQNRIATDRYGEVVLWDDIKRVLTEVQDADSD